MTNDLVTQNRQIETPEKLEETVKRIRYYQDRARAQSTKKAREDDWQDFSAWCLARGAVPMPASPEDVAAYISELADGTWMQDIITKLEAEGRHQEITANHRRVAFVGHRVATIKRRLAHIGKCHKLSGHPNPTDHQGVRDVMSGILREKGEAQIKKSPILTVNMRELMRVLPPSILGIRDKALLLVGFAGAFRRSELVGLDVNDVRFINSGMVVLLRRSKTDQTGKGREVAIPFGVHSETCPVEALRAWLTAARITEGPIFRGVTRHEEILKDRLTSQVVALVVKRTAKLAGLDPKRFAGHSLRAGLVTQAKIGGAKDLSIMGQTGHRDPKTVAGYARDEDKFRDNAFKYTGL